MAKFAVYQTTLNDSRRLQVNARGWGGVDWGSAYMNVTSHLNEENAQARVLDALDHGLYRLAFIGEFTDLEDIFTQSNAPYGDMSHVKEVADFIVSLSVGHVAVNLDTEEAFVCASFGFVKLSDDFVDTFLDMKEGA